jgi:GNAT superfamily N-acetyltransferase
METNRLAPNVVFEVASASEHFEQILQLQKKNSIAALSKDQQLQQGFVFAHHTKTVLKKMSVHLPQVIMLHNSRVVGYNLAMTSAMKRQLPVLTPMFNEFEKCIYKGRPLKDHPFMVGGQVCVDADFRGKGLMSKLYHETAKRLPAGYELCVTEIATRNTKSLNAHLKMGFDILTSYSDGKELWNIVVWNLTGP